LVFGPIPLWFHGTIRLRRGKLKWNIRIGA
jgi:hypothetical protein